MTNDATSTSGPADPFRENPGMNPRFLLGVGLAAGAAVVGVVIWLLILIYVEREFGLLAWGLGALVGGGMLLGAGRGSAMGSIVAAVIALVMIAGTKVLPALYIANITQQTVDYTQYLTQDYDASLAREQVASMRVEDMVAAKGFDYNTSTPEQDEEAYVNAAAEVALIPEEDLEAEWGREIVEEQKALTISNRLYTAQEGEGVVMVPYDRIRNEVAGMSDAQVTTARQNWSPPVYGMSFMEAMKELFSPFDILWSLLAVWTAFKVAAGGE
jgi:hypothetical protein